MFCNLKSLVLGASLFSLFFLPAAFNQVSARGAPDLRGSSGREMGGQEHMNRGPGMDSWNVQGEAYQHDGWGGNQGESWDHDGWRGNQGGSWDHDGWRGNQGGWQRGNERWSGGYPNGSVGYYNDTYGNSPNYSDNNYLNPNNSYYFNNNSNQSELYPYANEGHDGASTYRF